MVPNQWRCGKHSYPVTGYGTGDVSDRRFWVVRAPRLCVDEVPGDSQQQVGPEAFGNRNDLAAIGPPPQLGLGPNQQNGVTMTPRDGGRQHLMVGPHDLTGDAVGQTNLGANLAEVGEFFRVDGGKRLGVPRLDQRLQRQRGGIAGVVPARERTDHHRIAQSWFAHPNDVIHLGEAIGARRSHSCAMMSR
jgi:hypothetical protein